MSTSSNSSNNHHSIAKKHAQKNAYIDTLHLIREGSIVSRKDIPAAVQGVARRRAEALLEGITFYGLDAFWEMCNTLYYSYHWQYGWQDLRILNIPRRPKPLRELLEATPIDLPVEDLELLIETHRELSETDLSAILGSMERCAIVSEVIMTDDRELYLGVEVSTRYSIPIKAAANESDNDLLY